MLEDDLKNIGDVLSEEELEFFKQ